MYLHELVYGANGLCDDRTAIVAAEGEFSYKELWGRVSEYRALLEDAGVVEGDPVALHLPRCADYVACLIATLSLRAVAVPIDPDLPARRIAEMMDSTGATVMLCDRTVTDSRVVGSRRLLRIDRIDTPGVVVPSSWTQEPAGTRPDPSEAPAIILFTSGSTGTPKGVVLHHAGLVNRLRWGQRTYALDDTDRVLHKASIGFDASLHEIFAPLMAGATLVIAPPGMQFDAPAVVRLIQDAQVTTAHFVPSVLSYVADEDDFAGCTSLRRIFCGGEALRMDLAQRVIRLLDCDLFNQYGPTECSVSVTYWDCRRDFAGAVAPLGFPIDAVSCQVLGRDRQPVKTGEVGEIWVSGVAVGLGYLGGEYAQRFLPDPDHAGRRLYRTGDLGVLTEAGYLEFRGRVDDQVKIRGVRVEPEEVAHALRRHPMVAEAAVVAVPAADGGVRLVAFVAPRRRNSPVVNGLQRVQLADGMVVATPTPDEAMFLHRQIFHRREYARFGVDVREGAVVLDVGANIGLFSLWAHRRAPNVRVVAVEPNPDVLPYLELNLELAEARHEIHPFAVDDVSDTVELTSFPQLTYLSGVGDRHAPAQRLLDSYLQNTHSHAPDGTEDGESVDIREQYSRRLVAKRYQVKAVPLSQIIASAGLDRIDLLKINAEAGELAVLRSLRQEDWVRVQQVCVEVERASVVGPLIRTLLIHAGFTVHEIADWSVGEDADVAYMYATRDHWPRPPETVPHEAKPPFDGPDVLITVKQLRRHLHTRLPAQMQPEEIVLLERLPRLASGKLDNAGLALMAPSRSLPADDVPADAGLADWMAQLWRHALGIDALEEDDNFLALGGHSLIAMRICAAVRRRTGAEISVVTCMTAPTFGDWLNHVLGALSAGGRADA